MLHVINVSRQNAGWQGTIASRRHLLPACLKQDALQGQLWARALVMAENVNADPSTTSDVQEAMAREGLLSRVGTLRIGETNTSLSTRVAPGMQEAMAMAASGSHPNIVRYYSSWTEQQAEGQYFYILMEKCDVSLGTKHLLDGQPFREDELLDILRQVRPPCHEVTHLAHCVAEHPSCSGHCGYMGASLVPPTLIPESR